MIKTGIQKTGVMRRMVFSVSANYNQRFTETARCSFFVGVGPEFQTFTIFNSSTVGLRMQLGLSLNNYQFNTKIYFALDTAGGKIKNLENAEGYRFNYVSSRLGFLFNF
jgi:hypothetical protein